MTKSAITQYILEMSSESFEGADLVYRVEGPPKPVTEEMETSQSGTGTQDSGTDSGLRDGPGFV